MRLPRCPHCGLAVEEVAAGCLHVDTLAAACDPALYELVRPPATTRRQRQNWTRRQGYRKAGGTFAVTLPARA